MIKVIVIDDEAKARKAIINILEKATQQIKIIAECDGVKTGIEAISQYKPDLILLDIQLADGTAFDLIKQIGHTNAKIIFITAYDKYAISAFKLSAIDYILKPVNPETLIDAVQRASEHIIKENTNTKLNILLSNFEKEEKTIVLKTADTFHLVNILEIIRCEANGNYTNFYFTNGKELLVSQTLKEFDELFAEYGFFRTHNAHLINLKHLERCERTKGGMAYMRDGSTVPVALLRKKDLLELLQKI
jgi:two-component system LytT family response regulator